MNIEKIKNKSDYQFWANLSDIEAVEELKQIDLVSLKSVLWGNTAYKYLRLVASGKIKFSQIQSELRYLVTNSLAFLSQEMDKPKVKGLNVYILTCGLSFKTLPMIEHGYSMKIIDNKTVEQCEWILFHNVPGCAGKRFLRTDSRNTYIRKLYRKYEVAILSETQPKITQKEVKHLINNFYKYR